MNTTSENPTMSKEVLRAVIADSMGLTADEMPGDDEDLVDYGLHSIAVMQVVSLCQQSGVEVTFPQLIGVPTVDAWWRVLSAADRAAAH
ncbi:phosphopantetheine-binding protein [Streptomyces sp. NPDC127106]|uniref:phosphopantetheine-binding protein n=1 Tax=Streptomyces sp. NPDC127106 TaxID=3345360 RepID=UPI003641228A